MKTPNREPISSLVPPLKHLYLCRVRLCHHAAQAPRSPHRGRHEHLLRSHSPVDSRQQSLSPSA